MIFTSFKELHDIGRTTHDIIRRHILDSIRKEISNYVDQGTCFDTMYNAMNVLVGIGIALLERPMYYLQNPRVFSEALVTALLKIGKMLKGEGIDKVVAEMRSESEANDGEIEDVVSERLSTTCLHDFQNRMETQSKTDRFYHDLAKLQRSLDKDKYLKTSQHGRKSLLIKILFMKWKSNYTSDWRTCHNNLDQLLDLFVDTTVPPKCNEFLPKVERLVEPHLYPDPSYQFNDREERVVCIRGTIDSSIARILWRGVGRACLETRLNAWKALVKFCLRMLEWMTSMSWFAEILSDHVSENLLTSAMLSICYSLTKNYGSNVLSEHKLLDDIKELNNRRRKVRGAAARLDTVLKAIHHPEKMRSNEPQKRKDMVIDLTLDETWSHCFFEMKHRPSLMELGIAGRDCQRELAFWTRSPMFRYVLCVRRPNASSTKKILEPKYCPPLSLLQAIQEGFVFRFCKRQTFKYVFSGNILLLNAVALWLSFSMMGLPHHSFGHT